MVAKGGGPQRRTPTCRMTTRAWPCLSTLTLNSPFPRSRHLLLEESNSNNAPSAAKHKQGGWHTGTQEGRGGEHNGHAGCATDPQIHTRTVTNGLAAH